MVTNFIVQHKLPIATADHLAQLFKNLFPNSKIAASYAKAKTIIINFAIINKALRSVLAMMDQMILVYKR